MFPFIDTLRKARLRLRLGNAPAHPPDAEGAVGDWSVRRAPCADPDRVLQSATHLWLRRLPTAMHPKQLCRHFPRVANQLALAWPDPLATNRALHDLLTDRRGNRAGFPPRVREELERLQQFHLYRLRGALRKPMPSGGSRPQRARTEHGPR
jgi:hypothetical protein